MLKRGLKLTTIIVLVFMIIVIGDDETRHSLKQKMRKRGL